jgi:hypothetical protein
MYPSSHSRWRAQLGVPAVALRISGKCISKIRNDYSPHQQDGDEAWAQGLNGRWRLVRVIGDGFFDNIEVSKCASTVRVLATQLFRL